MLVRSRSAVKTLLTTTVFQEWLEGLSSVLMPLCQITIILFYLPIKVSDKQKVDALTDLEVIERRRTIYAGPDIIKRFVDGVAV